MGGGGVGVSRPGLGWGRKEPGDPIRRAITERLQKSVGTSETDVRLFIWIL